MSVLSESMQRDEADAAGGGRSKTWTTRKALWTILGVLVALSLGLRALDRLPPVSVGNGTQIAPVAATPPLPPKSLADALSEYQAASAACESAAAAMMQRAGTPYAAVDACGDSLRAVSDLPALYGPAANELQSCIDMEGARYGGLAMIVAVREGRGELSQNQMAEQNYRAKFHWAAFRCRSDLLSASRAAALSQ